MNLNINTWKNDLKFLFNFVERYDQDFYLDYPNEKVYWDEFFEYNYTIKKVDNIPIIKGLISDINILLALPDSHPLWDVDNLKDGIFSDIVVQSSVHRINKGNIFDDSVLKKNPTARAWITSVRDYMQEKLDNLKK